MEETQGSHISKFEWGFVVAIFVVIDIIQAVLDFFVAGVAINRFIDIVCVLVVVSYVKIRRVHMDNRSWSSIGGAFIGELIPVVDALPLWTLDILYLWSINNEGIAASAVSQTIGLKGGAGAIKAPTGSTPPVISTYGKTPPKIEKVTPLPMSRQGPQPIPSQGPTPPPLPRRIPPEPGIGDEPKPPIINEYRKTPPPIPRQGPPPIPQATRTTPPSIPPQGFAEPPVIETYGKEPPRIDTYGKTPPKLEE